MNELNLPDPDTHCIDDESGTPVDVWSYSPELVRQIVAADRDLQSARHSEELLAYEVTVSKLRTDAARYQWLRNGCFWVLSSNGVDATRFSATVDALLNADLETGEDLDRLLDAAMKETS